MASLSPKAGGLFRTTLHAYVRAGGIWRDSQKVYVRSGGIWRQVFSLAGIVQPFTAWSVIGDQAIGGGNSSGGLNFVSDGTVLASFTGLSNDGTNGSPNWFSPTTGAIGASYWIRATVTVGTLTTNPAVGWVALSTTRTFTKGPSASGSASATVTFEIATDAAGATIVFTSTGNQIAYVHV